MEPICVFTHNHLSIAAIDQEYMPGPVASALALLRIFPDGIPGH